MKKNILILFLFIGFSCNLKPERISKEKLDEIITSFHSEILNIHKNFEDLKNDKKYLDSLTNTLDSVIKLEPKNDDLLLSRMFINMIRVEWESVRIDGETILLYSSESSSLKNCHYLLKLYYAQLGDSTKYCAFLQEAKFRGYPQEDEVGICN